MCPAASKTITGVLCVLLAACGGSDSASQPDSAGTAANTVPGSLDSGRASNPASGAGTAPAPTAPDLGSSPSQTGAADASAANAEPAAGTSTPTFIPLGDELAGTDAGVGLAMNSAGRYFVSNSNTILYRDPNGVTGRYTGSNFCSGRGTVDGPITTACFRSAGKMAIDAAGTLYVEDDGHIRKVSVSEGVTTIANLQTLENAIGPTTTAGINVCGVALDSRGNLYVSTNYLRAPKSALKKISTIGVVSDVGEPAQYSNLSGVAIDPADNLYWVDNGRLFKRAQDGTLFTIADLSDKQVCGIAVEADGTVYALDRSLGTVLRIGPDGAITTLATVNQAHTLALVRSKTLSIMAVDGIYELKVQ